MPDETAKGERKMSENYREIIPLHEVLLRFYTYIFNPFKSKMKLEDLTDDQIKSLVMEDLKKVEESEEVGFQGYPLTYDYEEVIEALIDRRDTVLQEKYNFSSRLALIDSWMDELRDCDPFRIAMAAIEQRGDEKGINPATMQVCFDEYLEARIVIPWEIEEALGTDKIDDYPWKELNINFRVRAMQARILQPYLVDFLYEQKLL